MRSIILAMQGGVLDRCFLKIAYGRFHNNGPAIGIEMELFQAEQDS